MPVYMEVSRLHRCVTIVARGAILPEEIMGAAKQLFEAQVPQFAKLVDVAAANAEVSPEQIQRIAELLRGGPDVKRGPVAFLVSPEKGEFARAFAATQGERPVSVFTRLREARDWLARIDEAERRADAGAFQSSPWSDPEREAVMFRRGQRRKLPIRQNRPTYAV
ncbi:hypothetical protein [Reyranella sp.]|uniref:hypothetical protein n=1 Tax=Reyranella sp. TaxID=1929291 RepID=UPI003D13B8EC